MCIMEGERDRHSIVVVVVVNDDVVGLCQGIGNHNGGAIGISVLRHDSREILWKRPARGITMTLNARANFKLIN